MRKTIRIFLFVLCLVVQNQIQAQRRLPSQNAIQFTAGTVNGLNLDSKSDGFGFHFGTAVINYLKYGNYWKFRGEYLQKQHRYEGIKLPQVQITAEGGYFLNFLSDPGKTLFFSLGLSGMAGYETINWSNKQLPDGATIENKDGFLYGTALTLETEIFLTDWAVLVLNVRERMLFGSSVGKFNTQTGMGIRFIIN